MEIVKAGRIRRGESELDPREDSKYDPPAASDSEDDDDDVFLENDAPSERAQAGPTWSSSRHPGA